MYMQYQHLHHEYDTWTVCVCVCERERGLRWGHTMKPDEVMAASRFEDSITSKHNIDP